MDSSNSLHSQLALLKLSNGARVNAASITRPCTGPSPSVATRGAGVVLPRTDIVRSGAAMGSNDAGSPITLLNGVNNDNNHPHQSNQNNNNSHPHSHSQHQNNNNVNELRLRKLHQGGGEAASSEKLVHFMHSAPQCMQQSGANQEKSTNAEVHSSSNDLERLFHAALPGTVISTVREEIATPPVAIAVTDGGTNALRMSTIVSGSATEPKSLDQIDNFNAESPIIRTVPPCDGRYIIVGDVHGCPKQLEELMLKVNYQKGKDCLILAGDLVNKGPDSIGVVRLAQKLGAIGVLGNHDSTLLNCIARTRKARLTTREELDPVMQLAISFPQECEYYLRSLPHMLRIPKYNVLVVHAGLNMNNSIENQNIFEIMHMRRLEKVPGEKKKARSGNGNGNGNGNTSTAKPKWKVVVKGARGEPWAGYWKGPEFVVFGHDAQSGLQKHPYAYGIDTGCVYGCELTCVLYGPDSPKGTLVSVPGLPLFTNEKRGLPPPAAPVYEMYVEEMERQMLRPTSRVTPKMMMNGQRPTFLAAPPASSLAAGDTLPGDADGSGDEKSAPKLHALERASLLSLCRAGELRAVRTLINLPIYEKAWFSLLYDKAEDYTTVFWLPFIEGIIEGLLRVTADSNADYIDDLMQLALEACDELDTIRKHFVPQLRTLLSHEESGVISVSKATAKLLRLLTTV